MSNPANSSPDAAPEAAWKPSPDDPMIRIRGARTHNLRNIDVSIPRDRLVVITGPSGSGKSSLAFDTLFAEGQRQYIESLSVYARQFIDQMERPDVDLIEGLQPTISIDQRTGSHNPRSTVATVTEIYDYLRLLYARLGAAECYECGRPISQQSQAQILDSLSSLPDGTRMMILSPMVRGRRGEHREVFTAIRRAGLVRARVDGHVVDAQDPPELERGKNHTIEAVVDRIILREGILSRLTESAKLAIKLGEGQLVACYEVRRPDGSTVWCDRRFSTLYACPDCGISYEQLEPRSFSFNSPYGACPDCEGLGIVEVFDPELILPDRSRSLSGGAIAPWRDLSKSAIEKNRTQIAPLLAQLGIRWSSSLEKLSEDQIKQLLVGDGEEMPGVVALLERMRQSTTSVARQSQLEVYRTQFVCAVCDGSRLRPEARSVRVADTAVHELTALSVVDAAEFFDNLEFYEEDLPIALPLVTEISQRLAFLQRVGLGYLTLDRPAGTLSGGELQRVRLASGLGSGLVGVCYVLDEPSIGLHPRDNARLIDSLRRLQRLGNTVVVVEHDERIMREADWLMDLGPGAGRDGGLLTAEGTPEQIAQNQDSPTGRYLGGWAKIEVPKKRRRTAKSRSVTLEGAQIHNLKDVTVRFPLSAFICVTGVSGSGKSSLIGETLAPAMTRRLGVVARRPGPHRGLRGLGQVKKVILVDQSSIGRTPRSNAATYTGIFDDIRKIFAGTRDARRRGYKSGRFSFNTKGGRCEACQGQGATKIEMHFLPDLSVPCPVCEGKRFNRQTLEIHYRDKSIADVLDMSIEEAVEFFQNHQAVFRTMEALMQVGLGYLMLGQPSTTLSGGEAQRIKLATELSRIESGGSFYILDEPTTGLHFDDIGRLLGVLQQLVDRGNTVLVIEHNLDVIKSSDWIIDMGPEGGAGGGYVVAEGTPEQIAQTEDNHTGRFLREVLEK